MAITMVSGTLLATTPCTSSVAFPDSPKIKLPSILFSQLSAERKFADDIDNGTIEIVHKLPKLPAVSCPPDSVSPQSLPQQTGPLVHLE